MPRVFDVFMFRDELDVLECRLTELEDIDVTHVLVEATVTHQGIPKPLYYADNASRFSRWQSRIIHVPVDDLSPVSDYDSRGGDWWLENAQRERSWEGLASAEPDDIIIHSDCDEIIRAEAVEIARSASDGGFRFQLRYFIFACDWEIMNGEVWDKPAAAALKNISSFTQLRRSNNFPVVSDMGWHLSFFGGPEGIRQKMQGDCHPEIRAEVVRYADEGLSYEKGQFPFDVRQATPVEVDGTWPKFIREGRAPAIWYRPR